MDIITQEELKELTRKGLQRVLTHGTYYKYIDYNKGFLHILKENTLKFSDPEDFNDPFDCHECLVNVQLNRDVLEKTLDEELSKYPAELVIGYKEKYLKMALEPSTPSMLFKQKKKDYKISCFSSTSNEVLMWSHYADKHRGICIGFDLKFMNKDYAFYPVNYISEIRPLEGMIQTDRIFNYWLISKSIRWEYENEVRAISVNKPEIIPFQSTAIKEVIFGCNVEEEKISEVISYIKKHYPKNVYFKKMSIDTGTFLLKENLIPQ